MNLPFNYLAIDAVLEASGIGSKSDLYKKIREKKFPEPDRLDGRSRWRSDRIAQWLTEQAAKADADREARAKAARQKGQRMRAARGTQAA